MLQTPALLWIVRDLSRPSLGAGSSRLLVGAKRYALFRSLFRGREDVFPRRFESRKTGKSGYAPACANEWVRGICEKPRVKCAECPHRRLLPVTDDVIRWHLTGRDDENPPFVVGVYPMLPKNGLPPGLRNRLLRVAAFQNPEFYKAQAMRLPAYDKPRIIACAENHGYHIGLPRGCLDEVRQVLTDLNIQPIDGPCR